MEERIKELEDKHSQVKIIVDRLVHSNTNIEVSIATLSSEFKAMHDDAQQHEKTLRNLDESIKSLTRILNESRLENYKDTNSALTPIYDRIRAIETTLVDSAVKRIRTEAGAIFIVSAILIGAIYAYIMGQLDHVSRNNYTHENAKYEKELLNDRFKRIYNKFDIIKSDNNLK